MAANAKAYWIHALTPLHVGAGEGSGFIDLPILREKTTRWPVIPGSTVKGVLADFYGATIEARRENKLHRIAFGAADDAETQSANSGSLVFTDGRLVCLPVRSLYGTFAWTTSPLALSRLERDLREAGLADGLVKLEAIPDNAVHLPAATPQAGSFLQSSGKVYLGDLDFKAVESTTVSFWADKLAQWLFPDDEAWRNEFVRRFAVVSGDIFDFLCETATEVSPRIRVSETTKTVERGGLWYEESLPAETVVAGLVWCDRIYPKDATTPKALFDSYCSIARNLQVGGKATVGRGRVRCLFT